MLRWICLIGLLIVIASCSDQDLELKNDIQNLRLLETETARLQQALTQLEKPYLHKDDSIALLVKSATIAARQTMETIQEFKEFMVNTVHGTETAYPVSLEDWARIQNRDDYQTLNEAIIGDLAEPRNGANTAVSIRKTLEIYEFALQKTINKSGTLHLPIPEIKPSEISGADGTSEAWETYYFHNATLPMALERATWMQYQVLITGRWAAYQAIGKTAK